MNVMVITNNVNYDIKLFAFNTKDEAILKMEKEFKNTCDKTVYDFNNTYIDKENSYAQVAEGIKLIEFRIGQV